MQPWQNRQRLPRERQQEFSLVLGAALSTRRLDQFVQAPRCASWIEGSSPSARVQGHATSSGTYVAPHAATNPNGTQGDNYSATGNVNPSLVRPARGIRGAADLG